MKKLLSVILTVALVIAISFTGGITASAGTYGYFSYLISNNAVTIIECNTSVSGALEIPKLIDGYSVVKIDSSAFYKCSGLTSITIPDSVTSIKSYAFNGCTGLTSITIPASVTNIDDFAFCNCSGLTSITVNSGNRVYYSSGNCIIKTSTKTLISGCKNSVIPPEGITTIAYGAFYGCTGLRSITIPDSVTSIRGSAFSGCTGLESITIPDKVTGIGSNAFYECSRLKSITIPESVTNIGEYAFSYCSRIKNITVMNANCYINNTALKTNGNSFKLWGYEDSTAETYANSNSGITFSPIQSGNCGTNATFKVYNETLYLHGSGALQDYTLFSNTPWYQSATSIANIVIDSGITTIGSYNFYGCTNLKTVVCLNPDLQISKYYAFPQSENYRIYAEYGALQTYAEQNEIAFSKLFAPSPVLQTVTENSIQIDSVAGYEYSIGGTWSTYVKFTNLNPATIYQITARPAISENALEYCSVPLSVITNAAVPTVASHTANSVTLTETDETEYSLDGTEWQTDNTFENLESDRFYTFYQRTIGFNNSSALLGLLIPSSPMIQSSTDDSLTVTAVTGYEYSIDGFNWQTNPTFSGLLPGFEYTVLQRLAKISNVEIYQITSAGTTVLLKAMTAPAAPAAPTVQSKTETTVTLKSTAGYEYSLGGAVWQDSNAFAGLTPGTEYLFYQRVAATDESYVSAKSQALVVTTDKKIVPAPATPTVLYYSANIVFLQATDGLEYSFDGINWQTSSYFTNLTPATKYNFYQRIAETATTAASAASTPITVVTGKYFVMSPAAPTVAARTETMVTLNTILGYEYSIDGINWQASPVFSELSEGHSYTFYQRVAETELANASPASDGLTVNTLLFGDINGDGTINVKDLIRLKKHLFEATTLATSDDLDSNGSVDAADLIILRKILLNIPA